MEERTSEGEEGERRLKDNDSLSPNQRNEREGIARDRDMGEAGHGSTQARASRVDSADPIDTPATVAMSDGRWATEGGCMVVESCSPRCGVELGGSLGSAAPEDGLPSHDRRLPRKSPCHHSVQSPTGGP